VHDELVLECPEDEMLKTAQVVQDTMENAYPMSIPLETEAKAGVSWGGMTVLKSSRPQRETPALGRGEG